MSDYIERQAAIDELQEKVFHNLTDEYYGAMQVLNELPAADVVPVVRCKECKHFELNPVTVVGGIPLILAHEICHFWGKGCKTSQDGFCSYGERRER